MKKMKEKMRKIKKEEMNREIKQLVEGIVNNEIVPNE